MDENKILSDRANPKEDNLDKNKKRGIKKGIIIILAVFLIFYAGYILGNKRSDKPKGPTQATADFIRGLSNPKELFKNTEAEDQKINFDIFWEAWKKVDSKYVDEKKLDPQSMVYGAVKGMVEAIGDPYSSFLDPKETNDFNVDMEGSFEGIGAELDMREDVLTVIAPISGMPAEKAGLRAGDKIFKIDGEITSDMTIDKAVEKIRGQKGTEVVLTILRNGDGKTQDIKIVRDKIEIKSVIYEKKEEGIAYLRITKFSENTFSELTKEATKMIADGTKGIILDLRSNPGGYLEVSVKVASKFIPKGRVVVSEKGRNGESNNYKTIGGDIFSEIPIVVLIDKGSASASEILAGALRDNRQIKLIGEKSFGKGSVQQMDNFKDGSSLKITIAKWFTPFGQSIHEVGLEPDIKVEITEEDIEKQNDAQLNRALEEVKNLMK